MENKTTEDITKRYTDDIYASKDEVRKGLNMSIIDPFWSVILSYRSNFTKSVKLYNISSLTYFICYTKTINARIEETYLRLASCLNTFVGLDESKKETVRFKLKQAAISYVGQYYGETFTSNFASTVINGGANNLQGLSQAKKKAIDYYEAYKLLGEHKITIDADFLVKVYSTISRDNNLTSIYRNRDLDTMATAGVINREYNGIPFTRIEKCMNQLYEFIADDKYNAIVKAAASFYYINYVKPFEKYNNEIALLVFKAIIGNDNKEPIGYLLPFEELLKYEDNFQLDFKEANRGNDLTYVLVRVLSYSNGIIETFLDNCTNVKINDLRREHAPRADIDAPNDISSERTSKIVNNIDNSIKETVGIVAIPTIEAGLEEKDAHRYEKYLLEKNPTLKPAQAHFYARHCTMGSFYTIQMYKKAERVVYETARTSMDALTNLGFYEKRPIKNKFVYTPIKQKN